MEAAKLILNTAKLRAREITRDKEGHYIMIERPTLQDIMFNIYTQTNGQIHETRTLGKRNEFTMKIRDLKTLLISLSD